MQCLTIFLYVSEVRHIILITLFVKLFVRNCSSSTASVKLFIILEKSSTPCRKIGGGFGSWLGFVLSLFAGGKLSYSSTEFRLLVSFGEDGASWTVACVLLRFVFLHCCHSLLRTGGVATRSSLDEDRMDRLSLLLLSLCEGRVCFDVLGLLFSEYGFGSLWYGGSSVFGFG